MKMLYSYIFAYGCTSLVLLMGQCLSEFLSVSSVQNGETLGDFIRFDYSPDQVIDNSLLRVQYQCTSPCQVTVDVVVCTLLRTRLVIFRKEWVSNEHHTGPRIIQVQLRFPSSILYRQDIFNRHVLDARRVVVRAWLGNLRGGNESSTYREAFARTGKVLQTVAIADRPSKPPIGCPSWSAELKWQMTRDRIHQCPHESGTADMLKFPLASTGEHFGVVRQFQPFINRALERARLSAVKQPKVALSVWIYLLRWCHRDLCGIIHHVDRNNKYDTLLMQLSDKGSVIFQVRLTTGEDRAFRAHISLPLRTWVRLDCYIKDSEVTMEITWNNETRAYIYEFKSSIHYDDTNGYFVIGGSRYVPSIYGYFGTIKYYRFGTREVKNPLHPKNILENLEKTHSVCMQVKEFTKAFFHGVNQNYFFSNKDVCSPHYIPVTRETCRQTWTWETQLKNSILFKFLRRHEDLFRTGSWGVHTAKRLSKQLFRHTVSTMLSVDHTDIQVTPTLKALLEASSCFGNHQASLLLATLHLAGLGVSVDQQQGHVYSLIGALGDNRLALMHMGYKHTQGLDGFPKDLDMSLCYYTNIGAQSAIDHLNVQEEQQYQVEDIYLNNKEVLKRLHNGRDMVDFLKFQAERGDLESQKLLGAVLFWGSNGIPKDIGGAAKWMKSRALHMDDPTAMHDYSIFLLKGQGVEKNVTLAFQLLEKAASMGSVDALNGLGWYHSAILKDHKTAVKYFEQAALNGSNDGMYNLGVYHMMNENSPDYPSPNKTAAFQLFLNASILGHVQASVEVAWYLSTGSLEDVSRDTERAVIMLKNVSEKNGHLGYIIRKALHAYLDSSWHVAFVLYAMASETGLGLAQANTAQLCEELKLSNDCQWRYYNYSTLSYNPHPSALLKMGDHYYFSSSSRKDSLSLVGQAISMYSRAALAGSPQGLYNLVDLVQKGHALPPSIQGFYSLSSLDELNVVTEKLLERCVEMEQKDITACSLALLRVQMEKALRKMMLNDAQLLLVYASLLSFIIIIINVPMEIFLEHLRSDTEQRNVNRRPGEQTARMSAINQADATYNRIQGDVIGMPGLHRRAKNLWLMILNGEQRLRQASDLAVTVSGVCLCVFGTTLFYHLLSHAKPTQ